MRVHSLTNFMSCHFTIKHVVIFVGFFRTMLAAPCECCACDSKNSFIPPGYEKFHPPTEGENRPTYVYVNLDIMNIDQIIEETMEYSMQFYVSEYWKDERLNMTYFEKYRNRRYQLPREWFVELWRPDTIFENSKGGWIYPLSVPNVVIQIHSFGYLHRFTRYNMKISCMMQLQKYPMDAQNCFLIVTSSYDNSRVMFRWLHEREEGTEGIPDLSMADISPLKYYVSNTSTEVRTIQWPSGTFTSLIANFTFVRHLSSHIVNSYVPSGLVVVLSFLTFWLNVRSVPARVALGLTSLLTLSTQASQARNHLPPINYLTALDVWLFMCMMLVFSSLLEYAVVYHLFNERSRKKRETSTANSSKIWAKPSGRSHLARNATDENSSEIPAVMRSKEVQKQPVKPIAEFEEDIQPLDKVCRVLFPLAFAIFLAIYWTSYLGVIS